VEGFGVVIVNDAKEISNRCCWALRELGVSISSLAGKLEISIPSVIESVTGGQRIALARGCSLLEP